MIQRTLLLSLLVLFQRDLVWADDWPQWQGPDRTSISKEKGLLPSWPEGGPKLLWTFSDAGFGYPSMPVVGDRLYTMGTIKGREYVFALDLKTQKKLWSVEIGDGHDDSCECSLGTPVIDGHFLYAIGRYGNLLCVETADGKKVWAQNVKTKWEGAPNNYGYAESPLVDGNLVIVTPGGKHGALAAFDKKTGALKWRSVGCTYGTSYSSVIAVEAGGVRQYVQVPNAEVRADETVVGVRASDGKPLWEFPFPKMVATPIYHNGCIYVSSMVGCKKVKLVHDGDKFKAEQIYTNEEMKNHLSASVLVGEHLYGYSYKGVMCQEFKTGKTVWHEKGGGSGSVIFAEGNVYCHHANPGGNVVLIKATPAGYQELGKLHLPKRSKYFGPTYTQPVLANGKLYVRDQDLIFCYDVRKPH